MADSHARRDSSVLIFESLYSRSTFINDSSSFRHDFSILWMSLSVFVPLLSANRSQPDSRSRQLLKAARLFWINVRVEWERVRDDATFHRYHTPLSFFTSPLVVICTCPCVSCAAFQQLLPTAVHATISQKCFSHEVLQARTCTCEWWAYKFSNSTATPKRKKGGGSYCLLRQTYLCQSSKRQSHLHKYTGT